MPDSSTIHGYRVVFERAPHNWSAYVPRLPGCVTTGRTREETERNMAEAIDAHLELMRDSGEPVPPPRDAPARRAPVAVRRNSAS